MTFLKSNMILAAMFSALIGITIAMSATSAHAGPKHGAGFMGVSGLDLGSGR